MKTKNIFSLLAVGLLLASCDYNDKYFDGLDEMAKPQDIKGIEYTLTPEDYEAIAKNKTNIALAQELDADKVVEGKPDSTHIKGLKALAGKQMFDEVIKAQDFVPALLLEKWYGKDNAAAIKLTYNEAVERPEVLDQLEQAATYTVSGEEYETVWGEDGIAYFTPKKPFGESAADLLAAKFPEAQEGEFVLANYAYSIVEPGTGGNVEQDPVIFFADFEEFEDKEDPQWVQQSTFGSRTWQVRTFSNNMFLQFSAFGAKEKVETYILTPSIKIRKGALLSFDAKVRHYNGQCLSVKVSADYVDDVTKATWVDITESFSIPTEETDNPELVGTYDLSKYADKRVVIAFVYSGDDTEGASGVTTTIQLDNIKVSTEAPAGRMLSTRAAAPSAINQLAALYQFKAGKWVEYTRALALSADDYAGMGIKEFGKNAQPAKYLPKFLNQKYPYVEEGTIRTLVYSYNGALNAAEYQLLGGAWGAVEAFVPNTIQFTFSDGVWAFNPSTLLLLPAERGNAEVSAFYQSIVDWVWENIDKKELGLTDADKTLEKGYLAKYGNNEYYFGCSAYQNNMDFRWNKYKEFPVHGYTKEDGTVMSDSEIKDLVFSRVPEAFKIGLEHKYPDADVIDNMDIIYTVKFVGYNMANFNYTIKFKVVGKGEFEYIEGSFVED